jgi:hypothetical protein
MIALLLGHPPSGWAWWVVGAFVLLYVAGFDFFWHIYKQHRGDVSRIEGLATAQGKEFKEFVESTNRHLEQLNRENSRLTSEVTRFLDLRPKPNVVMDYLGVAQTGRFYVTNTGDTDATTIDVTPFKNKSKIIHWNKVGRLKVNEPSILDSWREDTDHPETSILQPLSVGLSPHLKILDWLWADEKDLESLTFRTRFNIEFYGDEGSTKYVNGFELEYDMFTKNVLIIPVAQAATA